MPWRIVSASHVTAGGLPFRYRSAMARPRRLTAIERTMRDTFGFEALRPGQAEVIRSVLDGHDTLAIMPTGAGKSLCYQLPALHLDGVTIIVSPLISLMKDQAEKLTTAGLVTSQLNSALSAGDRADSMQRLESRSSEFVLVTPERFTSPGFREALSGAAVDFIVVDEAHCVSQWGHDFRPAFLELRSAIAALGSPPVLALTATATPAVAADIVSRLGLRDARVYRSGIFRGNLRLEVRQVTGPDGKAARLADVLRNAPGAGIVYAATIRHVDDVHARLVAEGIPAVRYHGRLGAREREAAQDAFMGGESPVVVATNAFGMGIDKPDIRFVIHYDLPGSLEAYYQEAGRAGRDGDESRCLLLFDDADRRTQRFFLGGRYPSAADAIAVHRALAAAPGGAGREELQRASGVAQSRVRVLLAYFKDAGLARERRGARFAPHGAGLDEPALAAFAAEWEERGRHDRERLERVMEYGTSARCRWGLLRDYFGEDRDGDPCGACDNCLSPVADRLRERDLHAGAMDAEPEPVARRLRRGLSVTVPKFGQGRVARLAGDVVTVRFPDGTTRKFRREYVA